MLAVSDAGPLIALAVIDHLHILENLFDSVVIPQAVYNELCMEDNRPGSKRLKQAIQSGWLRLDSKVYKLPATPILLDPGEKEAILLAKNKNSMLLIDELRGRRIATSLDVTIIGTGRVLIAAKSHGLIVSVKDSLNKLIASGYRLSDKLYHKIIKLANE